MGTQPPHTEFGIVFVGVLYLVKLYCICKTLFSNSNEKKGIYDLLSIYCQCEVGL